MAVSAPSGPARRRRGCREQAETEFCGKRLHAPAAPAASRPANTKSVLVPKWVSRICRLVNLGRRPRGGACAASSGAVRPDVTWCTGGERVGGAGERAGGNRWVVSETDTRDTGRVAWSNRKETRQANAGTGADFERLASYLSC